MGSGICIGAYVHILLVTSSMVREEDWYAMLVKMFGSVCLYLYRRVPVLYIEGRCLRPYVSASLLFGFAAPLYLGLCSTPANVHLAPSRHEILQNTLQLVLPERQAEKLRPQRVLVAGDDLVIMKPIPKSVSQR